MVGRSHGTRRAAAAATARASLRCLGRSGSRRREAAAVLAVTLAVWLAMAVVLVTIALSPLVLGASENEVAGDAARAATTPRPPRLLSQTGLYEPGGTTKIAAGNRPYAPQYPLWSDGARKSRWVSLPPGTTIDAARVDSWTFPVGTRLWKEFEYGGRKVETRFLWKTSDEEWTFAAYEWNEAQTDAVLVPEEGVLTTVEVAPGKPHAIPGTSECRACHDSARTEILGFNALQLSTDRDPHALHAEPPPPGAIDLKELVERRLLVPSHEDLLVRPPRIRASSPLERTALGYLSTNCGGCHNPESSIASLGLFLKHASSADENEGEIAILTALGRPSSYEIPGTSPGTSLRVAPGAPERSAVLYRLKSRRPSSQMPPLGSAIADKAAVDLLTRWILESPRSSR